VQGVGVGETGEAVGPLDGAADAEVPDRQHVGAGEVEDQEHISAPAAQTLDASDPADDLFIGQAVKRVEVQLAVYYAAGQVAEVGDLGPRESDRAQRLLVGGEDLLGRRWTVSK